MKLSKLKIISIVLGVLVVIFGVFIFFKSSPEKITQIPADSEEPASGICELKRDKIVTITISSDSVPSPRCIKVWGDSRLNFSNALSKAVSFSLGEEVVVVPANSSKELDFMVINYFAPGVHWLKTIEGVGSIPELWIIPPAARSETATAPEFDEYPAEGTFKGAPAEVNFDSYPQAKTFKTKITEGAKLGPNFAGHYTGVDWGCGTQCQVSAIIDAENGNIIAYGISSGFGTSYRLESRLFIVNPNPGPDAMRDAGPITASDFYVMNDGKLIPLGRFDFSKGFYEPVGCPEIETTGRNVITGEIKTFSAPCLLPYGWEIVSDNADK